MKIKFDFKILIAIVIFYFTKQLEIYFVFMLFVFLHECGHCIVARILGYTVENLTIHPLGVSISFKVHIEDYNKKILKSNIVLLKKTIIATAGPITNFLFILLFRLHPEILRIKPEIAIYTNFLIGVFNLLPMYPLDGGRILRNLLTILLGIRKSRKITNSVMNILMIILTAISSIAILYYKNIAILLIIMYLWYLVIKENKRNNLQKSIYKY